MSCPMKNKSTFDMEKDFIRPDQASKCTWTPTADPKTSPHTFLRNERTGKPLPNILHAVGNTPLVKLNSIPKSYGIKCDMYAKCEYFNPGGSVKDRIGYRMVEDAERAGKLKPGCTIIEPTSGNTGIGLALAAAIKGYKCIIVMPEKMSDEKVNTLRALGAQIIRTPTAAAFDSPEGLIVVSQKLQKEIPNSVILDQYRNPGNPLAHYDTTADEILEAFDGKLDMIVLGAGTGGTVAGVGRRIKEKCPSCKIIGADPEGSILAYPDSLNKSDVTFYEIEGIGYDFIPTVLDREVVDMWVKINDKQGIPLARKLIREEGLLCGASSGGALAAALESAKDLKEGQKCVVLLPDGIRNYMTKFVYDQWMEERDLKPVENTFNHPWWNENVTKLNVRNIPAVSMDHSIKTVSQLITDTKVEHVAVVDANKKLQGIVTPQSLMQKVLNGVPTDDKVHRIMITKFGKIAESGIIGLASRILEKEPFVIVKKDDNTVVGILTSADILEYIKKSM